MTNLNYILYPIHHHLHSLGGANLIQLRSGILFNPSIYTKTVVDKIFQAANFTYNSDFFESPYFKRLILPYTGEFYEKTNSEIQIEEFRAGLTGGTQPLRFYYNNTTTSQYINLNCDVSGATTPDCYDNLAISTGGVSQNYFPNLATGSLPSGRFISNFYTSQKFETNINYKIKITKNQPFGQPINTANLGANTFLKIVLNTYKKVIGGSPEFILIGSTYSLIPLDFVVAPAGAAEGVGYLSPQYNITTLTQLTPLNPTDQVFSDFTVTIQYPGDTPAAGTTSYGTLVLLLANTKLFIDIQQSSRFLNVADNKLYFNNDITLNKLLPCEIKCSDFLMGLIE